MNSLWTAKCCGLRRPKVTHLPCPTIPLIDQLSDIQDVIQVWYADDASTAGSLTSIQKWCDFIEFLGLLMATMQMTARRDLFHRSSACPKQKSYSMTQMLRSHHEVGLTSYPYQLQKVCKGMCDKESSGKVGTTP